MSNVTARPVKKNLETKSHIKGMQGYQEMYQRSIQDPNGFWLDAAKNLDWFDFPQTATAGDFTRVNYSWYAEGKLNASYNCLDRHLKTKAKKDAIIWAKDTPGEYEHISYQTVFENVCRLTNLLEAHGVKKGDRVCIYLPMIPELVYSVLVTPALASASGLFPGTSTQPHFLVKDPCIRPKNTAMTVELIMMTL